MLYFWAANHNKDSSTIVCISKEKYSKQNLQSTDGIATLNLSENPANKKHVETLISESRPCRITVKIQNY